MLTITSMSSKTFVIHLKHLIMMNITHNLVLTRQLTVSVRLAAWTSTMMSYNFSPVSRVVHARLCSSVIIPTWSIRCTQYRSVSLEIIIPHLDYGAIDIINQVKTLNLIDKRPTLPIAQPFGICSKSKLQFIQSTTTLTCVVMRASMLSQWTRALIVHSLK